MVAIPAFPSRAIQHRDLVAVGNRSPVEIRRAGITPVAISHDEVILKPSSFLGDRCRGIRRAGGLYRVDLAPVAVGFRLADSDLLRVSELLGGSRQEIKAVREGA
ncbi:hypothetical protein O1611_g7047 [Lasiodiplodia mahajangana]|uniref:Uncharacterized protein n=1 Tax=Lasiodiplodia mahajangana TaxID=1108764 RepID=A0ACC2JGI9_9PEZI|nr:hypothetical protein O1611_g7047 [Lasiodiplodia mahajangana]